MRKNCVMIFLVAAVLSFLTSYALSDWSPVQRLTWTSGDSSFPAVAVDSSDAIHVVWHDLTPGDMAIYYKRSEDGGTTWSSSQRITWSSGNSGFPALAIDSGDILHVVWSESTTEYSEIYYKGSSDGGSTWTSARRITWTSGNSSFPAVGIDSNDDLHVIWCDQTPGPSDIYYKRSSDGGSTWTTSRRITWTSGSSEKSALAVDSSDALHVVWSDYQVGNPEIYYMRSTDGGLTWSVARRMTWTSGNSSRPAIAVDSSDTLHVVWNDWTPTSTEIYYRNSLDGGTTWSPVQRLTWNSGNSYVPAVAVYAPSIIYVVWYDDTPGNFEIHYRLSKLGGTAWSPVQRLTWTAGDSHLPVIAMDSAGTAHVFWKDGTPGNDEIYYRKGN